MSEYTKQANEFAEKYGVTLTTIGKPKYERGYFDKNDGYRYIFRLQLSRKGFGSYTFDFGQSINEGSNEPTMYDVLACLTKYDPCSFEDFCSDYGYERTRESQKTYKAVVKEWENVERLFSDVLDELCEIC